MAYYFTKHTLLWSFAVVLLTQISHVISIDIPYCNYHDTVNITGSKKHSDGSYLYEGVLIPPNLIGTYNYEILFDGERKQVPEHKRGCVCKIKKCIKFCCHPSKLKKENESECTQELSEELKYNPLVNITQPDGSRKLEHALDDFVVQVGIPCYDAYALSPHEYKEDEWELFANGTLLRLDDMMYFSKRDYCFTPHKFNGTFTLNPMNCPTLTTPESQKLNTWTMIISIPFIVLTILVYGFVPQLRNLHGKCLICYLFSLAIGYTMIVIITMSFESSACRFLGVTAYYFLTSAFFWLSVISFDLWHNFCSTCNGNIQRFMHMKRFYVYSAYAWGCPILLTIGTMSAQSSALEDYLKPGIGTESCWLKTDDWSAMIYFYGPNSLLLLFNMIMFILTSFRIYKIKRDLVRLTEREEKTRQMRSQKDNFGLFLRLFIVMGISWILETASYMVGTRSKYSKIFYFSDFCNAAQGVIIFILFVCKPKVVMLIKKSFKSISHRGTSLNHTDSTQSERSQEEMRLHTQRTKSGSPEKVEE